jgi:hypothetical protein
MKTPTRRLIRRAPGCYYYAHYNVERIGTISLTHWRWYDADNPGTGGEWRATLREARLDLDDFLDGRRAIHRA